MSGGAPPGGDDPARDWARRPDDDTDVTPSELLEFEDDARTPSLGGYGLGVCVGIEMGETRGAAKVLHVLRDELSTQTQDPGFSDEFVRRIAAKAGVKLG